MRSVDVAELKDGLSTYLTYAQAGEEIVIQDRNLPVAKLIPFVAVDAADHELVAAGLMRMPEVPWDIEEFLNMPIAHLKDGASLTRALLDERNEGR